MNVIKVDELPDLGYSSENMYLDDNYIILSPEAPILPELKKRLNEWGFDSLLAVGDPIFTEINSSKDAEAILIKKDYRKTIQEKEAADFFIESCKIIGKLFTNFQKGKMPLYSEVTTQIKNIIRMFKTHKNYLLNFSELEFNDIDYAFSQSIKTTILSIAMGEILAMPIHKLILLGAAAILHRIGTMQIPQDLFYSKKILGAEQKKSITLYPLLGFRSLKDAGFPLPVNLAVLEHRENVDGTGYPRGITGDKMSIYGKIVSVASSYAAIVSKRAYRKNMDPYYGMLTLIQEKGSKYDERVMRILLLTLTLYPVGTFVQMTDGSIGMVVEANSSKPKFPVLKLLFDYKMIYYADEPILKIGEDSEVLIEHVLTREETEEVKNKLPQ